MQIRYQDDDPHKRFNGSLVTLKKILLLQHLRLQGSSSGSGSGRVRVLTRVRSELKSRLYFRLRFLLGKSIKADTI